VQAIAVQFASRVVCNTRIAAAVAAIEEQLLTLGFAEMISITPEPGSGPVSPQFDLKSSSTESDRSFCGLSGHPQHSTSVTVH
jgi:hypothetical protein